MAKRIGTTQRKTRHKFSKPPRSKGKVSISGYLRNFKSGERVILAVDPGYQKGMYHPRFLGKVGVVKNRKGKCFEVSIKDRSKEKTLVVHPLHLKRA